MNRNDLIFAGTRVLGIYLLAQFALSLPNALRMLINWEGVGWMLLGLGARLVVGFALAVRTDNVLAALGSGATPHPQNDASAESGS